MSDVDELRSELAAVGVRRRAAIEAKAEASRELATLVPRAVRAGITPSELVRLTGLSRQGVRDFTARAKAPKR